MAFQKVWENPQVGLTLPDAYHRVTAIALDYQAKRGTIVVAVYRDAQARQANLNPVDLRNFAIENRPPQPDLAQQLNLPELAVANPEFDKLLAVGELDKASVNPVKQAYVWLKKHALYTGAVDV